MESFIYAKKFTCGVCEKTFDNSAVRVGKNPLVDQDLDLRPNYKFVDAIFYDVVHCPHCGYTALAKFFDKITEKQADSVREHLAGKHVPHNYPFVLEAHHALERYKLAILCAFHKGVKMSEKAMLYLKTAWVYRAMNNHENEKSFLSQAYHGFTQAYSAEQMPICGMEEPTVTYLLAELARRNGKLDEAGQHVYRVLQSSASRELKTKAETVRELIREARG